MYYIQDTRGVVGNCAMWWAKNEAGYTTDLDDAHVFSEQEIRARTWRATDVARRKEFVDMNARRHVRVSSARDIGPPSFQRFER